MSSCDEPNGEGRRGDSVGWAVVLAVLLYIHTWAPIAALYQHLGEPQWFENAFEFSYAPLGWICEIPVVGELLSGYLIWLLHLCGGEIPYVPIY